MEPACQDHSCTLNTWKSIPKIAGFITVYLVAGYKVLSLAVYINFDDKICFDLKLDNLYKENDVISETAIETLYGL